MLHTTPKGWSRNFKSYLFIRAYFNSSLYKYHMYVCIRWKFINKHFSGILFFKYYCKHFEMFFGLDRNPVVFCPFLHNFDNVFNL